MNYVKTQLHKKVMRRVYYAFALRLAMNPGVVHGFFMLSMLIALSYFVSIGNVLNNILNTKVNHLGTYFYNAATNTEAWTLLILGAIIFTAISLRFSLRHLSRTKIARTKSFA